MQYLVRGQFENVVLNEQAFLSQGQFESLFGLSLLRLRALRCQYLQLMLRLLGTSKRVPQWKALDQVTILPL